MMMTPPSNAFSVEELARRRTASRRMAWGFALFAALIYVGGFFLR
jgi:hypothetical protein